MSMVIKDPFGIAHDIIQASIRAETGKYRISKKNLLMKTAKDLEKKMKVQKLIARDEELDDALYKVQRTHKALIDLKLKKIRAILKHKRGIR